MTTKSDVRSQEKISKLEEEKSRALVEIQERWGQIASEFTETTINPLKKDIVLDLFGLAWMPFYLVQAGDEKIELPGFKAQLTNPS